MEKNIYSAWSTPAHSLEKFQSFTTKEQLEYLCLLGHMAASTHNTQPWRFSINTNSFSLSVYLELATVLPASDVVGRQSVISIGCAIENIVCGAKSLGLDANIQYQLTKKEEVKPLPISQNKIVLLATIYFSKRSLGTPDFISAIFARKVMRAEYDPAKKIPEDVQAEIEKAVDGNRLRLHTVTDPVRRLSIAEFQGQADGYVINSKKFSRELGEWLLPNDTESAVGMPGNTFGLDDAQSIRMHNGLLGLQPLQPEDGLRFALGGKIGMEKSPAIYFITAENDDIPFWIDTGRALQKMFLIFTRHGISTTVHAGIVEVTLINKMFAMTLGTTRRITGLFRAGYLKNPNEASRPHSPRRPLAEIIIAERP